VRIADAEKQHIAQHVGKRRIEEVVCLQAVRFLRLCSKDISSRNLADADQTHGEAQFERFFELDVRGGRRPLTALRVDDHLQELQHDLFVEFVVQRKDCMRAPARRHVTCEWKVCCGWRPPRGIWHPFILSCGRRGSMVTRALARRKQAFLVRAGIAVERVSGVCARFRVDGFEKLRQIRTAERRRRLGCWILGRRGSSFLSCLQHDEALQRFLGQK